MAPIPSKATIGRRERLQEFRGARGRSANRLPLEIGEADPAARPDPDALAEEKPPLFLEAPPAAEGYPSAAVDHAMPGKPGRIRAGMKDTDDLTRPARIPGERGDLAVGGHFPNGDGPDSFRDPFFEFHARPVHYISYISLWPMIRKKSLDILSRDFILLIS